MVSGLTLYDWVRSLIILESHGVELMLSAKFLLELYQAW